MERRDTIDISSEKGRGMSSRAASVNSLDLMSQTPTIPRITRDMTRSLSDAATRSQSQKQTLVTETELSSSWLYKTMQASINARFKSPRKSPSVHKTSELEQSILQDPELKPIPVKSKAAKTSTCICHFATMIAISLCAIGFLVSIAAIIYMEIFADRNITVLHAPEVEVDLSDVMINSIEAYNLTTHNVEGEEHVISEALTHRFDGDEEILNEVLKSSSTNDIPSLSNKNNSQGLFFDYATDVGNPKTPELSQDIDDTNSVIKFQDGVTVIYEMKEVKPTKDDMGFDLNDRFQGRSFGFEQTEKDSNDNFERLTENVNKQKLEQEADNYTKFDRTIVNDSTYTDNGENADKKSYSLILNKIPSKDFKGSVSENKLKGETEKLNLEGNEYADKVSLFTNLPPEELNSSELDSKDIEKDYNTDVLRNDTGADHSNNSNSYDNTQSVKDEPMLTNLSDSRSVQYDDDQSIPKVYQIADDHDVNTMLVTIDDTEVSTDSFLSKRNGEINVLQVSSPIPSVEPVKQLNENASAPPKKSVDIKVSLADAMKHLQKLDVNNNFLTSRTKSKQKVTVQKPKRKTTFNNEEEKKRYLQRMRLMLFKHLQ